MVYEYIPTYRDFLNAQRLYVRFRWSNCLSYYLLNWVVPIIGATTFFLSTFKVIADNAMLGGAGLWLAIVFPLIRWVNLRQCWKKLIPKELRSKPITLEFTDEQFISTIPGHSEGRFFWTAVPDFAQNERVTLLFVRKKNFLFVPTQAIPPEQWAEVREKLSPILKRDL